MLNHPASPASIALLVLLAVPAAAAGQSDTRIGLNLSVASSPEVGATIHPTPTLSLRPTVRFDRTNLEQTVTVGGSTVGVSRTVTDLAFGFDVFTDLTRIDDVVAYAGGGSEVAFSWLSDEQPGFPGVISTTNSDTNLNPRVFFGARVAVADRVSVYGEAVLSYVAFATGTVDASVRRLSLGTSALGVLVYLN